MAQSVARRDLAAIAACTEGTSATNCFTATHKLRVRFALTECVAFFFRFGISSSRNSQTSEVTSDTKSCLDMLLTGGDGVKGKG